MNEAMDVIRAVEENGGRLSVDGEWLVIEPSEAGVPVVEELRAHKAEIIALIQSDKWTGPCHDPAAWAEVFRRWMLDSCGARFRFMPEVWTLSSIRRSIHCFAPLRI